LLSHPVVNGFMAGSAVLIMLGQLFPLFGVQGHGHTGLTLAMALPSALTGAHPATTLMGVTAVVALALARRHLAPLLRRLGLPAASAEMGARLAPMCVVLAAIALTALFGTIVLLGLWPAPLVRELERAGSELLGVPVEAPPPAGHGADHGRGAAGPPGAPSAETP
jgi:SulP family sulfate permease